MPGVNINAIHAIFAASRSAAAPTPTFSAKLKPSLTGTYLDFHSI
jgi:hypothetical protein